METALAPEREIVRTRRRRPDRSLEWYAFTTPPQKEGVATKVLDAIGCKTCVPTEIKYRRKNRYAKSRKAVAYPMMQRYVFVGFDGPVPWRQIHDLPCISRVISVDGRPAKLPKGVIEQIHSLSGQVIAHTRSVNTHKGFAEGDVVRIAEGPLASEETYNIESIDADMAQVVMEFLGSTREIEIPLSYLEAG